MIKQLVLPLIAVALFIVGVGIFTKNPSALNLNRSALSPTPQAVRTMTLGNKEVKVEIANTAALRSKGLSDRNTLSEDYGMLFVFDSKKSIPSFWMKDMLIPIDIIWIDGGKVQKIDKDIPAPVSGVPDNKLPVYSPGKPVDYVLEVNAGFSQKYGVRTGDDVKLPEGF